MPVKDTEVCKHIHMKKFLSLIIILLCSFMVFAQNQLLVQGNGKQLYINHKVAPKENFYSIGRIYNISPKEIALFNGVDMAKGLSIGQTIKIPLNTHNFSQANDNGKPVYYEVGQKEGLYRVSLKNNNVLMATLRKWNHLSNDKILPGQKLIVGYLMTSNATEVAVEKNAGPEIKQSIAEEKKQEQKKEIVISKQDNPIKEEPRKQAEKKTEAISNPVKQASNEATATNENGGYFRSQFDLQAKTQPAKNDVTASAGIFKTASGWQDGKYYALMDGAEPGTIIKLTNPTNGKAVYAKVLGEMSGIRQNQGYDVRISNAAASALEVSDTDKFIVRVNY